jgi:hypothetical protein
MALMLYDCRINCGIVLIEVSPHPAGLRIQRKRLSVLCAVTLRIRPTESTTGKTSLSAPAYCAPYQSLCSTIERGDLGSGRRLEWDTTGRSALKRIQSTRRSMRALLVDVTQALNINTTAWKHSQDRHSFTKSF